MGLSGEITLVSTAAVQAVSVTGHYCALNCAHCGGHALRGMRPLALVPAGNGGDYLISGGSDQSGRVPLREHATAIRALGGRRNLHTGLPDEETLPLLPSLGQVVSFDFVWDEETITAVYGLQRRGADYLAALRAMDRIIRVVPHLTIGLQAGQLRGEHRALEILAAEGIKELVLLVYVPMAGSAWGEGTPPELGQVLEFLAWVRRTLPAVHLTLGCLRPRGSYRAQLDLAAVELGFDGLVNPTPAARAAARERKSVTAKEGCCVLA